jgi:diguanylate cyclase (GGDEF)-like protein
LQALLLFTPLLGQLLSLQSTDYKILALLLLIMCLMLILMTNTLYHMLHESQKIQYTAQTQARTDPLTQLANRRGFDQQLKMEWQRVICNGSSLSLLMIDVDHFKQYNDQKGHPAGDACLKNLAKIMRSVSQRKRDYISRYGGDEFSILLPDTIMSEAIIVAEKLRQKIAMSYAQTPRITLSIGVASCKSKKAHYHHAYPPQANAKILVDTADKALYQAKAEGRNCVVSQYCDRPL